MGHSWPLLLLVVVLGLALGSAYADNNGKATWSYHLDSKTGPEKWADIFPENCGPTKTHQSPINIVSRSAIFSEDLDDIEVIDKEKHEDKEKTEPEHKEGEEEGENGQAEAEGNGEESDGDTTDHNLEEAHEKSGNMSLFNNGHTAQVNLEEGDIYFVSKALGTQYKVAQLHFHWGKNGSAGSEHRINGKMFHLEMHIVTYDSEKYSTLGEAVGTKNGIAVFGVLFKKGKHNQKIQNVVSNLKHITKPKGTEGKVYIDWFDIEDVLPSSRNHYYRYEGSLTTPTCDETVKWTIFAEHPTVCPSQLKKFYSLREGRRADGEPVQLEDNFRPPQPLKDRDVLASFIPGEKAVKYNVVQGEEDQQGNAASVKYAFTSLSLCLCLARAMMRS